MSESGIELALTRRRMYSTRSDWGPPRQRSTFLSSQGRSLRSRVFSLRMKERLSSILKSSSRASPCTASTMSQSRRWWACDIEPPLAPKPTSSALESLRSCSSCRSFSCCSASSFLRSASSFSRSSVRKRFSTDSMAASSLAKLSSHQALRLRTRSMRACSRSRSSWRRCTTAPPAVPSSEGPNISSTLASMRALQLTAFRSSSQSSSSSVLTFSTAC
mmetsp:Transcript_101448/g.327372  ORF Transcript_101448/g.327372 Transcript_101448/m.327372 type:complete len:218 (-) Transcript_101448:565-1218(-)